MESEESESEDPGEVQSLSEICTLVNGEIESFDDARSAVVTVLIFSGSLVISVGEENISDFFGNVGLFILFLLIEAILEDFSDNLNLGEFKSELSLEGSSEDFLADLGFFLFFFSECVTVIVSEICSEKS